jgi:hypothetical protein
MSLEVEQLLYYHQVRETCLVVYGLRCLFYLLVVVRIFDLEYMEGECM